MSAQADDCEYTIEIKKISKQRTNKQNSSLWKWLTILAERLNDAGIDRVKLLQILKKTPEIEIQNDKDSLYDEYWLPVQKAIYSDTEGSSDLDTVQIQKVYETMNKHSANTLGISEPWPDRFNQ